MPSSYILLFQVSQRRIQFNLSCQSLRSQDILIDVTIMKLRLLFSRMLDCGVYSTL